jgi:hypothetical protein
MCRTLATIFLLLLSKHTCRAQQPYNFAVSVPVLLKADLVSHTGENKHIFGATGVDVLVQANGIDQNAMAFIFAAGILYDDRSFPLEPGTKLTTNLALLSINPSVAIASRWPGIRYNVGIGTLIRLGQGVEFATGTQSSGGVYTRVDSVDYKLTRASRSIILHLPRHHRYC